MGIGDGGTKRGGKEAVRRRWGGDGEAMRRAARRAGKRTVGREVSRAVSRAVGEAWPGRQ